MQKKITAVILIAVALTVLLSVLSAQSLTYVAGATITPSILLNEKEVQSTFYKSGIISVMDFGAKFDGITDDSDAIQAAINYVAGLGGGTILLPSNKTALIEKTILFDVGKNNITIMGRGTSVLKCGSNLVSAAVLKVVGGKNIKLEGFQINGDRKNHISYNAQNDINNETMSTHAIYLQQSSNVIISDIEINHASKDAIYINSNIAVNDYNPDIVIEKCKFDDSGRSSVVFIDCKNVIIRDSVSTDAQNSHFDFEPNNANEIVRNVIISHCQGIDIIKSAAYCGIATKGILENIEISNCYFDCLGTGFGGNDGITNITIRGNILKLRTQKAGKNIIQAIKLNKITFENNLIEDTATDVNPGNVLFFRDCLDVFCNNNTIKMKSAANYAIAAGVASTPNPSRYENYKGIISNNSIYGSESAMAAGGIAGTFNYIICGNTINGNSHIRNGITLGVRQSAINNNVKNCTEKGIYLTAKDSKAIGNQLEVNPIYVRKATQSVLDGNTLKNCNIILSECSDIIVTNNSISGYLSTASQNQGIYAHSTAIKISIIGNIIKNSSGAGILLAGTNYIVSGNRCYDDQITQTQTYGLGLVSGSDYIYISGNDFSGNSVGGIQNACANYRPSVTGDFITDMANFNFLTHHANQKTGKLMEVTTELDNNINT